MINNNKSAPYGYYGAVRYTPPEVADFEPQLPLQTAFSEQDRIAIQQLINQTAFYNENAPNILLRKVTSSLPNNVDTFVLSTSGKPEDVITYTSNTDEVNLNKVDGGLF
jgi:hypothetical protein